MDSYDSKIAARNVMSSYGLRASAVVQERIAEARQQGDTAGLERWQNIESAIGDLRRSAARNGVRA